MREPHPVRKETWAEILKIAYGIFDDLEHRGFGAAPFSLGGGTVLMFEYKHRLSKDIDLFGYDAQWLSLLTPRLNAQAAAVATDYVEQANAVKIVTEKGDIDFVIAADVTHPVYRRKTILAGRSINTDPPGEILAKKMLYRAAMFLPRDVYDLSAAIDIDPASAREAVIAAASTRSVLLKRLEALKTVAPGDLLSGIIPYDGPLRHGQNMIAKVIAFVRSEELFNDTAYRASAEPDLENGE